MKTINNDWCLIKRQEVKKEVTKRFEHQSFMKTTDIEKIILNSGVGHSVTNERSLEQTKEALIRSSQGQKPVITKC